VQITSTIAFAPSSRCYGIAIGNAAVILLTSIGEGTRRYILAQFSQFGTNLIAIHPGKAETSGMPGVFSGTTHHLTIDDAEALGRIAGVERVVPTAFGTARVEAGQRARNVAVNGVTPDIQTVWKFRTRQGVFWPESDPRRGAPLTVLGRSSRASSSPRRTRSAGSSASAARASA
jgi:putative ABC transport system permease protein